VRDAEQGPLVGEVMIGGVLRQPRQGEERGQGGRHREGRQGPGAEGEATRGQGVGSTGCDHGADLSRAGLSASG